VSERLLGLVSFVPQALQLLPAVSELVNLVRSDWRQRGAKRFGQELEVYLVPDLRGAHYAQDAVQLVQPLLVGAVESARDRLAVRGSGRVHHELGHVTELCRVGDKTGGHQRKSGADPDWAARRTPLHLECPVGPACFGE